MIYTITLNPALDRQMTVPEIALDSVLRAKAVQTDFGGKGFNVSRALLSLGMESTVLAFVGGAVGEQLAAGLAGLGIRTDFVHIGGETRINLSVVADDHTHYFKVNEPGPTVTGDETAFMLAKISKLAKQGDWWVLAGSLPPGIQPAFIADIIQHLQEAGAYTAIDMEGACLQAGCAAKAFLAKPNANEAGEITGRQIASIQDAIATLPLIHALGPKRVVISLGKTGAVYSDGEHIWSAEPPLIEERNPIGAGDAMLAGIVWAMCKDMEGSQVLRWGIACGAAAASLDGTAMGSFSLVESLASTVSINTGG